MNLCSGGYQVWVTGQNLDVAQEPKMRLTSNSLNLTLISVRYQLQLTHQD